jgi:L-alanine-DL-glutamate epimerase-like enolase superfamily enzyme
MSPDIQVSSSAFRLKFKFPFKIAHGIRTHTDAVFISVSYMGHTGYGEATLPPYLPETTASVTDFINSIKPVIDERAIEERFTFFKEMDAYTPGNTAAKAALDMALWDLKGKIHNKTVRELLSITGYKEVQCTYTIGLGSKEEMAEKIAAAKNFSLFKLKLNGINDEQVIQDFTSLNNAPFAVDANQAWKDVAYAESIGKLLVAKNCLLIEQPFAKEDIALHATFKAISPLPVIADESCQRLDDIDKLQHAFDGINIKLQKCGGITEARQMIEKSRQLNLKILLGCMSESSCGCSAAAQLAPLADWVDLDGPYLISNDPFDGMRVINGNIQISAAMGTGALLRTGNILF